MRRAEHIATVAGADVVAGRRQVRAADGVLVPAGGVAFVVVFLPLAELRSIEALVAHQQGMRSAVGDFGHPARLITANRADSFRVAGGVIAQSVLDADAADIQWIAVSDALWRAARAAEVRRVCRADSDEN